MAVQLVVTSDSTAAAKDMMATARAMAKVESAAKDAGKAARSAGGDMASGMDLAKSGIDGATSALGMGGMLGAVGLVGTTVAGVVTEINHHFELVSQNLRKSIADTQTWIDKLEKANAINGHGGAAPKAMELVALMKNPDFVGMKPEEIVHRYQADIGNTELMHVTGRLKQLGFSEEDADKFSDTAKGMHNALGLTYQQAGDLIETGIKNKAPISDEHVGLVKQLLEDQVIANPAQGFAEIRRATLQGQSPDLLGSLAENIMKHRDAAPVASQQAADAEAKIREQKALIEKIDAEEAALHQHMSETAGGDLIGKFANQNKASELKNRKLAAEQALHAAESAPKEFTPSEMAALEIYTASSPAAAWNAVLGSEAGARAFAPLMPKGGGKLAAIAARPLDVGVYQNSAGAVDREIYSRMHGADGPAIQDTIDEANAERGRAVKDASYATEQSRVDSALGIIAARHSGFDLEKAKKRTSELVAKGFDFDQAYNQEQTGGLKGFLTGHLLGKSGASLSGRIQNMDFNDQYLLEFLELMKGSHERSAPVETQSHFEEVYGKKKPQPVTIVGARVTPSRNAGTSDPSEIDPDRMY